MSRKAFSSIVPVRTAGNRRLPLYLSVAQTLEKEIEEGKYPVDTALPTEEALVERFQVSRHTVRQALRELKENGLILSRAGLGTIVRSQPEKVWYISGLNSLSDLIQFATETEMTVVGKSPIKTDRELAQLLNCEIGREWFRLEIVRRVETHERPLSFLTVYVHPEHASKLKSLKTLREPIFSILQRTFNISIAEVRQEVTADALDHAIAAKLDAVPGQAALRITRHYYDRLGELVHISLGYYPSGRYTQTTRIRSTLEN